MRGSFWLAESSSGSGFCSQVVGGGSGNPFDIPSAIRAAGPKNRSSIPPVVRSPFRDGSAISADAMKDVRFILLKIHFNPPDDFQFAHGFGVWFGFQAVRKAWTKSAPTCGTMAFPAPLRSAGRTLPRRASL